MAQPARGPERQSHAIPVLAVSSGLSLLPLLGLGIFSGIKTLWFELFFLFHLLLFVAGLAFALIQFCKLTLAWGRAAPLLLAIALGFLGCAVIEGLAPITSRDALIHHLAVPKWWIAADRIYPIEWHEWSYYPMLLNLAYTGLMSFGLDRLTSLYHLGYLILLSGVVARAVFERSRDESLAALGFLVTLTLPLSLRLGSSPLVDLGLALYSAIPFLLLEIWTRTKKTHLLVISGISIGLALSCKYNGILACVLFLLLLPVLLCGPKTSLLGAIRAVAICAALALLVFSPWAIKNEIWAGNPIYPLYRSIFGTTLSDQGITPSGMPALQYRMWRYGETPLDLLLIPMRMIFQGRDNDPRYFDGVLSPILLMGIFALAVHRKEKWLRFEALYSASYLVLALFTSSARSRYLTPIAGPALCLAILGISSLATIASPSRRRLVLALSLAYATCYGALYMTGLFASSGSLRYQMGSASAVDYLRERIPEYRVIERANASHRGDGTTYLLFTGNRYYYYDIPVMSGGHFSESLLRLWIRDSSSTQQLVQALRERGISHILENKPTRELFVPDLPLEELVKWDRLYLNACKHEFSDGAYHRWEIVEPRPEQNGK